MAIIVGLSGSRRELPGQVWQCRGKDGTKMKKGVHPDYVDCTITCGCGEVVTTRSTKKLIAVEICSKCHPFFTGQAKLIDTMGRVEKFQRRYNWGKKQPETGAQPPAKA